MYSETVPGKGGETHFCGMYGAHDLLDPVLKNELQNKKAVKNCTTIEAIHMNGTTRQATLPTRISWSVFVHSSPNHKRFPSSANGNNGKLMPGTRRKRPLFKKQQIENTFLHFYSWVLPVFFQPPERNGHTQYRHYLL